MKKDQIVDHKKRILFFHPGLSTFIIKDIEILSDSFDVISFEFKPTKNIYTILLFFKQFFFILKHVIKTDLIICKFSSYHSLIPLIIGKIANVKSVLINGGLDCSYFPGINYGNFRKPLLGYCTQLSYKLTNNIITLHRSMIETDYTYDKIGFPKQGFNYFVKGLNKPVKEIYNGYDKNKWYCDSEKNSKAFVSIAYGIGSKNKDILKGIDLINKIAPEFPDCNFILIGQTATQSKYHNNIITLPPQSGDELRKILSSSMFYLQLSISEGFPNSLCEAMLCECIPIGSNVTSIPDIIGNTGYILKKKDKNRLIQLINNVLETNNVLLGKKSRKRIIENFSIDRRRSEITKYINNILRTNV